MNWVSCSHGSVFPNWVFSILIDLVFTKQEGEIDIVMFCVFLLQMIDDQDLGFFANFLGVFIFVLVIAYHYVVADPKYEGS